MTTNLDMAQKLFGTYESSASASTDSSSSYGSTSSVRYGTVTEVDGNDITVVMDDTDSEVYFTTNTPVSVGDRVTIVLNGSTYLVYTLDTVEEQIDSVTASVDEVDAAVAENKELIESEVSSLNETIESIETTVNEAVDTATEAASTAAAQASAAAEEAAAASESVLTLSSDVEGISNLIRETDDGLEVARIVDDEYTTTHTLMTGTGFAVYAEDGETPMATMGDGFLVYDDGGGLSGRFSSAGVELFCGTVNDEPYERAHFSNDGVHPYGYYDGSTVETARFYDGGTVLFTNDQETAEFTGEGIWLFDENERTRVAVTTSGINLYDGSSPNTSKLFIGTGSARIGAASSAHLSAASSGLVLYDEDNEKAAAYTSDGVELFDSGTQTAAFTDSGVSFYDTDGNTTSFFGNESFQIGEEGAQRLEGSSDGVTIYNEADVAGLNLSSSGVTIYDADGGKGVSIGSSTFYIYSPSSGNPMVYIGSTSYKFGNATLGGYLYGYGGSVYLYDENGYSQMEINGSSLRIGRSSSSKSKVYIDEDSIGIYVPSTDDTYPFWIGTSTSPAPENAYFRVSDEGNCGVNGSLYIDKELRFQNATTGTDETASNRGIKMTTATDTWYKSEMTAGETMYCYLDETNELDPGYDVIGVAAWTMPGGEYGYVETVKGTGSGSHYVSFYFTSQPSKAQTVSVTFIEAAKGLFEEPDGEGSD